MILPEVQGRRYQIDHVSTIYDLFLDMLLYLQPEDHSHSTNLFQEHVPNAYRLTLPNPSRMLSKKYMWGPITPTIVTLYDLNKLEISSGDPGVMDHLFNREFI